MKDDLKDLKQRFLRAGIVEQLIYINLILYLFTFIFGIFGNSFFYTWFALPASYASFFIKPWTIITYGFLHAGFFHILGNLIALYYFGYLFLEYFTKKQLLNFYLFGTFIGGLFFLAGPVLFPMLRSSTFPLVGASAGVSAILIGITTYIPDYRLNLRLIGYVKLKYIALFWILYNLLFITASINVGGNLAHLGGALFGFLYVQQASNKELDVFAPIRNLFKKQQKPLKTVHKSENVKRNKVHPKSEHQQQIDAILDKISKSGYNSLTQAEKDFLFKQGKK